jgi:hypothetical protein
MHVLFGIFSFAIDSITPTNKVLPSLHRHRQEARTPGISLSHSSKPIHVQGQGLC